MHKGFGYYAPHESTSFFLKALLLSFWIGVDMLSALLLLSFPASTLVQHGPALLGAAAILAVGTVYSLLFAWATGALFGRQAADRRTGVAATALQCVKRQPYYLIGIGAAGSALLLLLAFAYFSRLQKEAELVQQTGRANAAIAKKCMEVAALERTLFQTDEQFIMTQCLLQYDRTYAAMHERTAY